MIENRHLHHPQWRNYSHWQKQSVKVADTHTLKIYYYHSDNRLFDTIFFKNSVINTGYSLPFCSVNAQHQIGNVESKMKYATNFTRPSLIHTSHIWPKSFTHRFELLISESICTYKVPCLLNSLQESSKG